MMGTGAAQRKRTLWDESLTPADVFTIGGYLRDRQGQEDSSSALVRVAIVGNVTTDFLGRAAACALAREGMAPLIYHGRHAAFVQDILDSQSPLHKFRPDATLIAVDWRDLVSPLPLDASDELVDAAIDSVVARYRALWESLRRRGSQIYQHVPASPPYRLRGIAERFARAGVANQFASVSDALLREGRGIVNWIDVQWLAEDIGRSNWSSQRLHAHGALPFDPKHLPAYMRLFGSAWRAANGKEKRVLVLDLDGTLWGGAAAEDGVEGIELGPDSPAGTSFATWQTYVRDLRARGVILAACSKNDPGIAAEMFSHRHAPLSRDDFAAFECSWNDKATGLRKIAASLDVGLDTLVFADDNEAECDLIRQELPMVGVVHLGVDPSAFIGRLEREHWFDVQDYTRADFTRAESYAARSKSHIEIGTATNLDSYLASLTMRGTFRAAEEHDFARIAQLERKTNQFNMTAQRYGEAEIREFAQRLNAVVRVLELRDRYADHGLVSSLLATIDEDVMRIDSWVMSCRVFCRTAEIFIMQRLLDEARSANLKIVRGRYMLTQRNAFCAQTFAELGFTPREDGDWELRVDGAPALRTHVACTA